MGDKLISFCFEFPGSSKILSPLLLTVKKPFRNVDKNSHHATHQMCQKREK